MGILCKYLQSFKNSNAQHFAAKGGYRGIWFSWLALCVVVCLIHIQTLDIYPLISQDEVQIVDFGRAALDPSTTWSLTWNVRESTPVLPFSYLGPILQELAYKESAPSGLGPRYLSTFAAFLAATCALGWLIARKTPPFVALLLASAFLVDPIFSEIYLGGRIDGWSIAACLASCWLLRTAVIRVENALPIRRLPFYAGILLAVSPFFWPNSILLLPLVLLECFYLARALQRAKRKGTETGWFRAAFEFCLGGLAALVVLLIPIFLNADLYLSSAIASFSLQKFASVIQFSPVDLFLVYDPVIFVAVLVAIAVRREAGMLIAFAFSLFIMYQTMIYLARVLYLLPYFLAMIGCAYSLPANNRFTLSARSISQVSLVLLIGWNVANVLVINPIIALAQKPANSPDQFMPALADAVGDGPHRVLLEEWSLYYSGRSLGWNIYLAGDRITSREYNRFLSTMDYVVLPQAPKFFQTFNELDSAGFELKSTINFSKPDLTDIGYWSFRIQVPQNVYPPISIYRK